MKNVIYARVIRKACKKSVNVFVLIFFAALQIFPPPHLWAAGEIVLDPVTGVHVPVKPYLPGTGDEEGPVSPQDSMPALKDKPLSAPTSETSQVQNESRDLPEYSFEDAVEYLTPDYSAAVIVRSVTAEDLKKLTELNIEVGVAVLKGKLVFFTSGNHEEIRLLPAAKELLKEASLIAHTHPNGETSKPSYHDYTEAGDETEYLLTAQGVYAYNRDGQDGTAYDFEYLAKAIEQLTDKESSTKPVRDLLNAFIQAVDEYNQVKTDSTTYRASHIIELFPSASLVPADITPLPGNPDITRVTQSSNDPTQVVGTYRGLEIQYNTSVAGWGGGGFFYSTARDLSALSELRFGLQGGVSQVKLEVIDQNNQKVSIQLKGILSSAEKVWAVPTSALDGIDLTKVKYIYFIVEGLGQIGTLQINQAPPSSLTTADITLLPGNPQITRVAPAGNTSGVIISSRGVIIQYDTNVGGWAGGGFRFDDFSTVPIETQDLSGFSQLVFGLKGDTNEVKFEIVDDVGNKASYKLRGIRSDQEQAYAIPASALQGVDLTRVRLIYFIIEGSGKVGTLEVNRIPKGQIIPAPSNPDYEFLILDSDSGSRELRLRNKITGQFCFLLNLGPSDNITALDVDPGGKYALLNAPVNPAMGSLDSRQTLIFDIPNKQFVKPNSAVTGQPIDTVFGQTQFSYGASPYQFVGGVAIYNVGTPRGNPYRGIFINLNGSVPVLSETASVLVGIIDINRGTPYSPQLVLNGTRILFYVDNTNGRHLGLYDMSTGALNVQLLPFLAAVPRAAKFVLKAVSPDGRFAIYRDDWDFIYAVDYENINRPVQYFQIPGLDPNFFGSLGTTADFRLNTAAFLDNNTVEAFLVNGERFLLHIDANDFRILEGPRVIPVSATLTPADLTPIPAGFVIEDRSPQNPAQTTATTRGLILNYDTNTSGYSGGVVKYTSPADFSALTDLVVGLKGNASQVILEVWSFNGVQGAVKSVYLTGISPTQEKAFAIPTALLTSLGIDVTNITSLRFMVEGPHQEGPSRQGVLEVNFQPTDRPTDLYQRPGSRTSRDPQLPQGLIYTASNPDFGYTIEPFQVQRTDRFGSTVTVTVDRLTVYKIDQGKVIQSWIVSDENDGRRLYEYVDISPDGKFVVFSNFISGDVYVHNLETGEEKSFSIGGYAKATSFTAHEEVVVQPFSFDGVVINLDTLTRYDYGITQEIITSPNGQYSVKDERPTGRLLVADNVAGNLSQLNFALTELPVPQINVTDGPGIYFVNRHDLLPKVCLAPYSDLSQRSCVDFPDGLAPQREEDIQFVAGQALADITVNGTVHRIDLLTGQEVITDPSQRPIDRTEREELLETVAAPNNANFEFLIYKVEEKKEVRLKDKITGVEKLLTTLEDVNYFVSSLDVDPTGRYAFLNVPVNPERGNIDERNTLIYEIDAMEFVHPVFATNPSATADFISGQNMNGYQFLGGVAMFNASWAYSGNTVGYFIDLTEEPLKISQLADFARYSPTRSILDLNGKTSKAPYLIQNGSKIVFRTYFGDHSSFPYTGQFGDTIGVYDIASDTVQTQPLAFLVNSSELVIMAWSPSERFALARDEWNFLYAIDFNELNKPIQYFQLPGMDPNFITGVGLNREDFKLRSASFVDENKVEAVLNNGDIYKLLIDSKEFRILEGLLAILPSADLKSHDITAMSVDGQLFSYAEQLTITERGAILNYNTVNTAYSSIQWHIDDPNTPFPAIETVDLSDKENLIFGVRSDKSQIRLQVESFTPGTNKTVITALYLSGVQEDAETVFQIPAAKLAAAGIDLENIRSIGFFIEGPHQEGPLREGQLEVNFKPTPFQRSIPRTEREFTQQNLIDLIKNDLLKDQPLIGEPQGVETGHPGIVAARVSVWDAKYTEHLFIYSTDGEELLHTTGQDGYHPFQSLTIDDTGKIAVILVGNNIVQSSGLAPWTLYVYELGEDNDPELVRQLEKDTVTIQDPPGDALNITIYPNFNGAAPGGTLLEIGLNGAGRVDLLQENPSYLPPDVLAGLPSPVSNPNFKIAERMQRFTGGSTTFYDIWSTDGNYVMSVIAGQGFYVATTSATISTLGLDISPDGKYLIHAYSSSCTRSSSSCAEKQFVDIYSLDTKQKITTIQLKDFAVNIPRDPVVDVQFLPGSSIFFSVTYQSGIIEIYNVTEPSPQGWIPVPSNANFAYRVVTQPVNNRPLLQVMDLTSGQIYDVDGLRSEGTVFQNVDVTADGKYATYNIQGGTKDYVVPLGTMTIFERAKSNPNYAFYIDIVRLGPGANQETLQLLELSSGNIQNLFTTQTPFGGLITRHFDVSPDTFSGGPVVVFETADDRNAAGYPFRLRVQRINGAGGTSIVNRYFQLQSAFTNFVFTDDNTIDAYANVIFPSGTEIEDHYTVTESNGAFLVSGPLSKVLTVGQGLHIDTDTPLVVQPELLYPSQYIILLYDSSNGVNQLRLVKTISGLGGDSRGQFIFSDAYTTPAGRQIVSVGVISGHFNGTWIVDADTGEKLFLQDAGVSFPGFAYTGGAVTSIEYEGDAAAYTLLKQDGSTIKACVDLSSLQSITCRTTREDINPFERPIDRTSREPELTAAAKVQEAVRNFYGNKFETGVEVLKTDIQEQNGSIEKAVIEVKLKNELASGKTKSQKLVFEERAGQLLLIKVVNYDAHGISYVRNTFEYEETNGTFTLKKIIRRSIVLGLVLSTIRYVADPAAPYYEIKTLLGKRKRIHDLAIRWFDLLREAELLEGF